MDDVQRLDSAAAHPSSKPWRSFLRSRRFAQGRQWTQEEVARKIGVSPSYYSKIEQGIERPSEEVLLRVAETFQLDPSAVRYLFELAERAMPKTPVPSKEQIGGVWRNVLETQGPHPAYIMGRRWDVLAWNQAACAALIDFEALGEQERNIVWLMFTWRSWRENLVEWEGHSARIVAQFRAGLGNYEDEPIVVELVDLLKQRSARFTRLWRQHDIKGKPEGHKAINHPAVGRLDLVQTTLRLNEQPELRMVLYLPWQDNAGTARKLQMLYDERVRYKNGVAAS